MALIGCRSAVFAPVLDGREDDALVREANLPGTAPALSGARAASPGHAALLRDLEDLCSSEFRDRALAHAAVLARGTEALDGLERARARAPAASHARVACSRLIEAIQRDRPTPELVRELTEARGYRRIAAIRVAGERGAECVPALLPLVAHQDAAVRGAAVMVLGSITSRHPLFSGEGPVPAIRVWREWYDAQDGPRPSAGARREPVPRTGVLVPAVSVVLDL